jgi:hypothetical protein
VALGALALVLLIGATGFAYWRDTRFPARSEPLRGTPVVLRVQDGVTAPELHAIRTGVRLTARFMRRTLGSGVTGPVEARVARSNGCHPFQSAGEAVVGEAEAGFMCIDTSSPAWSWMMLRDRLSAAAAAGHEYVHVLQGERGCLHAQGGEDYRWVKEGMADELAWRALVAGGIATGARVAREIRADGALDTNLEPLSRYEHDGGRDAEYALWHLAVQRLLGGAVAAGVAPARRPEAALGRFCDRVGRGRPWRTAFRQSFGVAPGRFYVRFERRRAELQADVASTGAATPSK